MSATQIIHVLRLIGYFIIHLPSILVIYWQTRMFINNISGDHGPSRRFTRFHHLIAAGFGELIYDLATVQGSKSNRSAIASSVVYLAILVRLSDDILDNPKNTNVQKNAFLDRLQYALRHDSETQAQEQEEANTSEIIPLRISKKLFVSVFSRDSQHVSQFTWDKLVSCARKQLIETEPETLLGLEQTVARLTLEMFVLIVEISEGVENRNLRTALGFMGGYGQSLDNIRDIDSDLKDGTRTYGTTMLVQEGDTEATRNRICLRYIDISVKCYKAMKDSVPSFLALQYFEALKAIIDAGFSRSIARSASSMATGNWLSCCQNTN